MSIKFAKVETTVCDYNLPLKTAYEVLYAALGVLYDNIGIVAYDEGNGEWLVFIDGKDNGLCYNSRSNAAQALIDKHLKGLNAETQKGFDAIPKTWNGETTARVFAAICGEIRDMSTTGLVETFTNTWTEAEWAEYTEKDD